MNRRLEDEIARLAFGDLPPARAQALERLSESDAGAVLRRCLNQNGR